MLTEALVDAGPTYGKSRVGSLAADCQGNEPGELLNYFSHEKSTRTAGRVVAARRQLASSRLSSVVLSRLCYNLPILEILFATKTHTTELYCSLIMYLCPQRNTEIHNASKLAAVDPCHSPVRRSSSPLKRDAPKQVLCLDSHLYVLEG